ncbi:MAG TPA: hypothetical protein VGI64_14510 [Streptosporangiaceae bacterium]|jgi:hypothetical protein
MPDSHAHGNSADSADNAARALQAVQVALDRRDNGGDGNAPADQ